MAAQTTYATDYVDAIAGSPHGNQNKVIAMVNNEASAEMAFGRAVAFEGSTDDQGALLPDASTDIIAGILQFSHSYDRNAVGSTGVVPGKMLNVMTSGMMMVVCEGGCSPGDPLHVRIAGGTEGALRASPDLSNTIDCGSQGRWLTTATDGNLALLMLNFSADNKKEMVVLAYDNASLTADTTVQMFSPTRAFRVTGAKYVNPTGLAAHATNFFNIKVQKGATVIANWSTESGEEGALVAGTYHDLTMSATDADRSLAAGDNLQVIFDEDGTATLPVGRLIVEGYYL